MNDYLELDCCKQIVHIDCLNIWIKSNIKNNVEIDKCFHCKGSNDYINTIIYYTRLEEGTYENTQNNNLDNVPLVEVTNSENYNCKKMLNKCSSTCFAFIGVIIIINYVCSII
tara:strand:+ start:2316 stop:2654 length:339 start_codon:yes stop_codon:yes gene_type:complete